MKAKNYLIFKKNFHEAFEELVIPIHFHMFTPPPLIKMCEDCIYFFFNKTICALSGSVKILHFNFIMIWKFQKAKTFTAYEKKNHIPGLCHSIKRNPEVCFDVLLTEHKIFVSPTENQQNVYAICTLHLFCIENVSKHCKF